MTETDNQQAIFLMRRPNGFLPQDLESTYTIITYKLVLQHGRCLGQFFQ
jgi:hypothetical protein